MLPKSDIWALLQAACVSCIFFLCLGHLPFFFFCTSHDVLKLKTGYFRYHIVATVDTVPLLPPWAWFCSCLPTNALGDVDVARLWQCVSLPCSVDPWCHFSEGTVERGQGHWDTGMAGGFSERLFPFPILPLSCLSHPAAGRASLLFATTHGA